MPATEVREFGFSMPAEEAGGGDTRQRRRWVWWVAGALVTLLLAAGVAGAVGANGAMRLADELDGRLLPDSVIAGVAVGGLTPAEAVAAVSTIVDPKLDRPVEVRWRDAATWQATPRELGSASNLDEVVAEAVQHTAALGWEDLLRMRWLGALAPVVTDVTITHSSDGVAAFVDEIAAEIDREPLDAAMSTAGGWVDITSHRIGYRVDTGATTERLLGALEEGRVAADLSVERLEPEVLVEEFSQVLLVRQAERKLYLYSDGEITHSWNVAIGAAGYPTPKGTFELTLKRYMPTWINPAPTGWGAGMPARIGPGRSNPLGVRALNWSVGAIRFHGTENLRSIGTAASKGCVRLTNNDVIELYDLVDEGATIVSL